MLKTIFKITFKYTFSQYLNTKYINILNVIEWMVKVYEKK